MSIANLLGAIDASRARPLSRVLIGLGIRHLGQVGSVALARACRDIDGVLAADEETLAAIDGVGPVIAVERGGVVRVTGQPFGGGAAAGGRARPDRARCGGGRRGRLAQTLEGRSVVVTGTLEGYTREEAEAAVVARGGKSPGTVSKKTWAVVVGREPGASKVTKAEQLGVPMVDGDRFDGLLATGELPAAG